MLERLHSFCHKVSKTQSFIKKVVQKKKYMKNLFFCLNRSFGICNPERTLKWELNPQNNNRQGLQILGEQYDLHSNNL